jgi:outer membrane protein OmpA-like peptidoglycan-associated protein
MSHASLRWLTLSLSLVATGQAQEKPPLFGKWPIELQGGLSLTGYGSHEGTGLGATTMTVNVDPRTNLNGRLSVEPFCIPKGRLQVSFAYNFGGDATVGGRLFNLKDEGGVAFGALYLYPVFGRWELGAGLDARHDNMRGTGVGTLTESHSWNTWLRGVARHNFPWAGNRSWFVALEGGLALGKPGLNNQNYYQDFTNLTHTYPAGVMPSVASPASLARGHMPSGTVSLAVGVRWGNYAKPCGGKVAPLLPPPTPAPKPQPEAVPPPPPAVPASQPEVAPPPPSVPSVAPAPAATRAVTADETKKGPEFKEVEGLVVRFALNRHDQGKDALAIVKAWAKANKDKVDAGALTVTGHCDESGGRTFNEKLSQRRAKAVVAVLRKEGILVEESQISGQCWDIPEVPNTTEENRAKNRRGVIGVKEGTPFKVVRVKETPVIVTVQIGTVKKK